MSLEDLQKQLDEETKFADRQLAEKADALKTMDLMAEAARCIVDSFRMTLKAHNLSTKGHLKAFARYNKARKQYDDFRNGTLRHETAKERKAYALDD